MHCMIGKKKVEEMSEGREDALDIQINNRSPVIMRTPLGFPLPAFSTICSLLSRSDLINFQHEEIAIEII